MDYSKPEVTGVEEVAVELAVDILQETLGSTWEKTRAAVNWLMSAGLPAWQAIGVTNQARRELGLI